jgi:hypothetical protein
MDRYELLQLLSRTRERREHQKKLHQRLMMFANLVLIKWKIPLISLLLGFMTLIVGLITLPMAPADVPLNPTFSAIVMVVSIVAMTWAVLVAKKM